MKKYDELTARLLERRDSYVAAQAAKRKRMLQVALPMSGGLLAAVIGIALWQGGVFENTPPVTDGVRPDAAVSTTENTTADTTEDATVPTATVPTDIIPTVNHSTTVDDGTTADKTTSATGNPHSTTTTEQPTAGKTDPTTGTTTKPTTKPTTDKTELTTKTTKTTQSSWDGGEFNWDGDTIVVETPITHNDAMPVYYFSATLPTRCSVTDEYAPVLLSYGHTYNPSIDRYPEDDFMFLDKGHFKYIDFKIVSDNGEEILLNSFTRADFITLEYYVDMVVNEKNQIVDYVYAHTETIQLPLSLCTKESGRISFSLKERKKNGDYGNGGGINVYYKRTVTDIQFSVVNYYGQGD